MERAVFGDCLTFKTKHGIILMQLSVTWEIGIQQIKKTLCRYSEALFAYGAATVKVHLFRSPLDYFSENHGALNDEQGETIPLG